MEDNNSKYQVFTVNSVNYLSLSTKKYDMRKKWQKSDPKEIRSIIPGSVIDILVTAGQKVKAAEVLLILDSMKMHTKIEMPYDGIIKSIHISKGDRIPKDTLMMLIE
jgi:biotin carboxyl carrier protein